MMRIQELIGNAFRQTGSLVALTDGGQMNPNKLQKTLEQTMEQFEAATLELRKLCERYAPGSGGFAKKPILPSMDVTGSVEAFGYMRYPAVRWNRRRRAFLCPDCDGVIEMEISEDGSRYTVPADQFFFQKEHKKNHTCPHCGMPLWSAVNPDKRIDWVKIGEYGWVYRYGAQAHLHRTKNERVLDQLAEIAQNPDAFYPIRGAHRRFPLSTYIKKKLRGRIDGFLCDELHEYNNNKGNLQQHIFAQLKYELLNCKAAFRLCGMTGAPRGFQKSDIISLDIVSENSELHEQLLAA